MLKMRGITMSFFGKKANDNIDFDAAAGEIHALLGENGAGKTTLMNILYGLYTPDAGSIEFEGREARFRSPAEAIERKIGMVHQHFTLVPTLTVSQNITLGTKPAGYPFTKRALIDSRLAEIAERYNLSLDPKALVKNLSMGEKQRVEIVKLLYRDAKLLILDEPTAVLSGPESEALFKVLKSLRDEGRTVIIITHRLKEAIEHANRITILRDGKKAAAVEARDTSKQALSRLMIGEERDIYCRPPPGPAAVPRLRIKDLCVRGGRIPLEHITFDVHSGEILGIAGVDGNGQEELSEAVLGIRPVSKRGANADVLVGGGAITLDGVFLDTLSVRERRKSGLAFVSGDRQRDSLILDMTLTDNFFLTRCRDKRFLKNAIFVNDKKVREETERLAAEYDIKTPSLDTPSRYLSGGNQQKLVLARELWGTPRALVASHITRGLDIGAASSVHERLLALRESGCAILLISADLDEILRLAGRVAVMYHGCIMKILPRAEVDLTSLGLLMAGIACLPDKALD